MCKANCLIFIVMMFIAATSSGQTGRASRSTPQTLSNRSPEQWQYKGIREPVNYAQDLALTDVFFVNTDVGYVSSVVGTILKTSDSSATWTPLLGGDPQSREPNIDTLRFLDQTHELPGKKIFAVQKRALAHALFHYRHSSGLQEAEAVCTAALLDAWFQNVPFCI